MGGRRPVYMGWCDVHRKALYLSRKYARRAARLIPSGGPREYRCSEVANRWHIGHIPRNVKKGKITATEIYDKPARTTAT